MMHIFSKFKELRFSLIAGFLFLFATSFFAPAVSYAQGTPTDPVKNCCKCLYADGTVDFKEVATSGPAAGKCNSTVKDTVCGTAKQSTITFDSECKERDTPAPSGGITGQADNVPLKDPLNLVSQAGDEPLLVINLLIQRVVNAALGIMGVVTLIMFIYGGIIWMSSQGEAAKIEKGMNTMIWAAIGLLVVFGSYAIVTFLLNTLTGTTPTP